MMPFTRSKVNPTTNFFCAFFIILAYLIKCDLDTRRRIGGGHWNTLCAFYVLECETIFYYITKWMIHMVPRLAKQLVSKYWTTNSVCWSKTWIHGASRFPFHWITKPNKRTHTPINEHSLS